MLGHFNSQYDSIGRSVAPIYCHLCVALCIMIDKIPDSIPIQKEQGGGERTMQTFFLLLNSVYTVLPLSQGLDIGLKGEQYI